MKKGVGEEMVCAGKKAQAIFICMFTLLHGGGGGGGGNGNGGNGGDDHRLNIMLLPSINRYFILVTEFHKITI